MIIKIKKILSITLFLIMLTFAEITRLAPTPDELKGKAAIEIKLDYIPKIPLPSPDLNTLRYLTMKQISN